MIQKICRLSHLAENSTQMNNQLLIITISCDLTIYLSKSYYLKCCLTEHVKTCLMNIE